MRKRTSVLVHRPIWVEVVTHGVGPNRLNSSSKAIGDLRLIPAQHADQRRVENPDAANPTPRHHGQPDHPPRHAKDAQVEVRLARAA